MSRQTLDDGSTAVFLGVEWTAPDGPRIRLGSRDGDSSFLVASSMPLRYAVEDGSRRYCCGWFDVSVPDRHVTCDGWRPVTGTQCPVCRRREGFQPVHQAHRDLSAVSPRVRAYLSQPHRVYLAMFGDGTVKVGTVAEERLVSRLAEQGAVAATYVALARDGVSAREAESALARDLGLALTVRTRRKLAALGVRVQVPRVGSALRRLVAEAWPVIAEVAAATDVVVPEEPQEWVLPETAHRALEMTPVTLYPEPLHTGRHSLFVRGMVGSIGVFAVSGTAGAPVYCHDLHTLRGYELTFGEYSSSVDGAPSTLF